MVHLAFRGVGIFAVSVALADATVGSVDEHFRALIAGNVTRLGDRGLLRRVDGRCPLIASALHGPTVFVRDNMLIFLRHFDLQVPFPLDAFFSIMC